MAAGTPPRPRRRARGATGTASTPSTGPPRLQGCGPFSRAWAPSCLELRRPAPCRSPRKRRRRRSVPTVRARGAGLRPDCSWGYRYGAAERPGFVVGNRGSGSTQDHRHDQSMVGTRPGHARVILQVQREERWGTEGRFSRIAARPGASAAVAAAVASCATAGTVFCCRGFVFWMGEGESPCTAAINIIDSEIGKQINTCPCIPIFVNCQWNE